MKIPVNLILSLSLLATTQTGFCDPIPRKAPTPAQIADAMNLPRSSVIPGRSNMDPHLGKDRGVCWRYSYRLSTKPGYTLVIAVLSAKYLPKADEALGEPDKANPPARKSTAPNGDVISLFANPIPLNRLQSIARLERHEGDWDLLAAIFPDSASPSENPAMLEDTAMKTFVERTARILSNSAAK